MKGIVISILVVLAMIQFMAKPGEAAVSCGQVDSTLVDCMFYLTAGGTPPGSCCQGVKKIKEITPTTEDRRAACACLKDAAGRNPNIKEDAASTLPQKCGVEMNIPISKSTNCANIN